MKRTLLASSMLAAALSVGAAHATPAPKPATTVNGGGSSLAFPLYTTDMAAATTSKVNFSYEAVGSGAGQNAFLNNNINYFEPVSGSNTVGYAAGTLTYGTIAGTAVDFGASDAFLTASQLTNPATGSYAQSSVDGPIIQLPTVGVPITIPFNQASTTALTLTDSQLCGVLSGKITDWHSINPAVAAGTNILVTYRSDSSGTTFLLTQHLNAVCTSANSNFSIPVPITKTFATEFPGGVPSTFTGESGSGGVAGHLTATPNSFGYLSPDYTSIAPNSPNKTSLLVASLVNATDGKTYAPTTTNTTLALANPGPTSAHGTPPANMTDASNPLNWVPALPTVNKGYPIVGYTTVDFSTCYANATVGKETVAIIRDFLKKTGADATNITNNGFVPLANSGASKFYTQATAVFFTTKAGYGLNVDNATTCAGLAGR